MPMYMEVVIDLRFIGLSQEILCTCNKLHQLPWMPLQDIILRVRKVLPSRMLLLEGQDGQTRKDHVHNCVPCHFPHVNAQIDLFLTVVPTRLRSMLCGQVVGVATMLICKWCSKGWHMGCFMPPLHEILVDKWFFP